MNGDKALFPLFTKALGSNESIPSRPLEDGLTEVNGLDGAHDEDDQPTKQSKARKTRKKQVAGQKTLQEIVNPRVVKDGTEAGSATGIRPDDVQEDEQSPRRSKRRRTSRTDSVEVGGQQDEVEGDPFRAERRSSPQVIIPASSPLPTKAASAVASEASKTPPKKMLRLKAGGKFSSPVSKNPKEELPPTETVKKRGRPRKSRDAEQERHLVAVMKYDPDTELGGKIIRILAGEERFKKQVKIIPKKQNTPRKADLKSAHPFFSLDRRKEHPGQPTGPSPRKASAVTPGKLRRETMAPSHALLNTEVHEVWNSTLLKDRLMFRHPGAKDPAWPDKEQSHVRGLTISEACTMSRDNDLSALPRRKMKAAKRSLTQSESIVARIASHLAPEEDGKVRPDGFREPHPSLKLPARSLTPGQEIARKVAPQLSVSLADLDADELSQTSCSQPSTHPALRTTYNKISETLSSFDEGQGEVSAWSQKYAPLSSIQVLQSARQTTVLKDWLLSLKVSAVDIASRPQQRNSTKPQTKTSKKKRRRKDDDLDDFLVDSDEDVRDMDELTDPEDILAPSQGRKALNSIVEVAADGVKLSNAVLLSGPHGCGKTAAAYAVAKELDFKVFEISSSERRSGKDVLDKVGDMTENHLVKHHGIDAGEQSSSEEPNAGLDEAFQRDLASGRQGKMASFFKPQAKAKAKPKASSPKEAVKKKALDAVQNVLKKAPKDQQQSLILLEEVDILFKEDKEFWTTVLKLITTSKRPFIMTCNDEDLIPLQAMSLHAILRFSPPPLDLATDYLLLVAAAEGHLLRRGAVSSLYQRRDSDLRAALSELNLWCQMGVGDPRGGLSWIYQRYPPGSDLDEKGRRLRVVSESTYRAGMGSISDDACSYEDKLRRSCVENDIDASDALGWCELDMSSSAVRLKDFSNFADDLSAIDLYGRASSLPALDVTQKPMKDKSRAHYIDGLPLLQADEQTDYSGLSVGLLTAATLLVFQSHNMLSSADLHAKLKEIDSSGRSTRPDAALTRHSFACFDAISVPVESALSGVTGLQQSAFDGPLGPIATDIAPYVRSIVHFDVALAEQREALGGGKAAKRARTTRAARSALEGGQRGTTRRERWFSKALDFGAVLATGGSGWPSMLELSSELAAAHDVEGWTASPASAENTDAVEADCGAGGVVR